MTVNSVPTAGTYPTRHNKREAKVIETARQGLAATADLGDLATLDDVTLSLVTDAGGMAAKDDVGSGDIASGSGILLFVAAGEATTAGGAAAEVLVSPLVLAGDHVVWSILDSGTNVVTGVSAVAGSATVTFTFSADPGNDAIVSYMVVRAA